MFYNDFQLSVRGNIRPNNYLTIGVFTALGFRLLDHHLPRRLNKINARTCKLEDFGSKEGNNFINDTSENCLQPKVRQSFDNNINNHGKNLSIYVKTQT
jgi:hypothetical protein